MLTRQRISTQSITVFLFGGLGNQMFQYATGFAASLDCDASLQLDTSWFTHVEVATPRPYLLDCFPYLKATQASDQSLRTVHFLAPNIGNRYSQFLKRHLESATHYTRATPVVCEPHAPNKSIFHRSKKQLFLTGYWQNEEYFAHHKAQVKEAFLFPPLAAEKQKFAQVIAAAPVSVALHVRRGDYVNGPVQLGTATQAYYREAVKLVKNRVSASKLESLSVFVFSDDSQWVKQNLDLGDEYKVVFVPSTSAESPLDDMHLMSLCSHHVIANSSYSWWGAWLAQSEGIVCAPDPWFAGAPLGSASPCPARWERIEGEGRR